MKRYRSVKLNTDVEPDDEIVLSEDFGEDFGMDELSMAEEHEADAPDAETAEADTAEVEEAEAPVSEEAEDTTEE